MLTQEEIINKYEELKAIRDLAHSNLNDFLKSIKDICEHPDCMCTFFERDCDNGYGRWWKEKAKRCRCGQNFTMYGKEWRKV
jgi:hypothetical protein